MYWMVFTTLFWAWTFGSYDDLGACQEAARNAPWYVSTSCVPMPEPHDHKH